MKTLWQTIPMGLAVLCLSAPALAQYENPGQKPDVNGPDAGYRSGGGGGDAEWQQKNNGIAIKLGVQLDVLPGKAQAGVDTGFALMLSDEYHIFKPLWFQIVSGLYVNGHNLDIPLQLGFLVKLLPGAVVPTFRATATVDFKYYFHPSDPTRTPDGMGGFDILVGSTFGPGFRWLFGDGNSKGLVFDLDFFIGQNMYASGDNNAQNLVWSVLPMVGIEF